VQLDGGSMDMTPLTSPNPLLLCLYVVALVTSVGDRIINPGGRQRNKKSGRG